MYAPFRCLCIPGSALTGGVVLVAQVVGSEDGQEVGGTECAGGEVGEGRAGEGG